MSGERDTVLTPTLIDTENCSSLNLLDTLHGPHEDGPRLSLERPYGRGVWFRSLGLGKYEAMFRENDIDEADLPSLTHDNLKELGVASLGRRVKLLDAVAALRGNASGKPTLVDPATTSSAPSARPKTAPNAAKSR